MDSDTWKLGQRKSQGERPRVLGTRGQSTAEVGLRVRAAEGHEARAGGHGLDPTLRDLTPPHRRVALSLWISGFTMS